MSCAAVRYNIVPLSDMNFGAMLVNSKKSKTFLIENRSEKFETKYVISRVTHIDPGDVISTSKASVFTLVALRVLWLLFFMLLPISVDRVELRKWLLWSGFSRTSCHYTKKSFGYAFSRNC